MLEVFLTVGSCYNNHVGFFFYSYFFLSDRLLLITWVTVFWTILSLCGLKTCYVPLPCPYACYHEYFHRLFFGDFFFYLNTSLQKWDYKTEGCFHHAFIICWNNLFTWRMNSKAPEESRNKKVHIGVLERARGKFSNATVWFRSLSLIFKFTSDYIYTAKLPLLARSLKHTAKL